MNISRNGITFVIQKDSRRLAVTANDNSGRVAHGYLANSSGKRPVVWPRLEFWLHGGNRWIESFCDHRYWNLDDYETHEEAERRPVDTGHFDLTSDETAALQAWCDSQFAAAAESAVSMPATPNPVAAEPGAPDIDSGLGIGRIGDTDPTSEVLAEWEAIRIIQEQAQHDPHARTPVLCDCGHYDAFPMNASLGTVCAGCYDRWSD